MIETFDHSVPDVPPLRPSWIVMFWRVCPLDKSFGNMNGKITFVHVLGTTPEIVLVIVQLRPSVITTFAVSVPATPDSNFFHCVLASNLPPNLGIEALRRDASRFPGYGEAIAQDDDAEGKQAKLRRNGAHRTAVQRAVDERAVLERFRIALRGSEVVLAGDVRLDMRRSNAWSG